MRWGECVQMWDLPKQKGVWDIDVQIVGMGNCQSGCLDLYTILNIYT